jgi:heme exporter protein C
VEWWNTLHQGQTISLTGGSKMHASMLWPLIATTIATKAWFLGSLLQRARAMNLEQEAGKDWVRGVVDAS